MGDNFTAQLVTTLLTSTTTDREDDTTMAASCDETFWAEVSVEAAASDTVLKLNLLTSPLILVVIGDTGITFKLDSDGTDDIGADPIAVISNEGDGLSIDEILLSNSDSQAHTVVVIAFE